jgi:chemotaxis protein CheD
MVRGKLPADFDRGVVTTVHQGECLASGDADLTYSTLLGSCISACIRDSVARVGGMNHFLLAEAVGSARDRYGASARYGWFAMEQLINMVLSLGTGRKKNLEIKVFGGGLINGSLADIGAKNIEFVREFLADEGYAVVKEDLGGSFARRVMFKPSSGRAFVKRLDSVTGAYVAHEEMEVVRYRPTVRDSAGEVELF